MLFCTCCRYSVSMSPTLLITYLTIPYLSRLFPTTVINMGNESLEKQNKGVS